MSKNNIQLIVILIISLISFVLSLLAQLIFGTNFFFIIAICCTLTSTIISSYALIHNSLNKGKYKKDLDKNNKKEQYWNLFPKNLNIKLEESYGDDFYQEFLSNSSSIIKVWLFNSKLKSKIYEENLDDSNYDMERYNVNLQEILNQNLQQDFFFEEPLLIADKSLHRYTLVSKTSVILVFITHNKISNFYLNTIKKAIEKLEKEYQMDRVKQRRIKTFLDENIFLYHSRLYKQIYLLKEPNINEIFKKKGEKDLILEEIPISPPETFLEFIALYNQLTEEIDPEETMDDNYELLDEVFK